MWANPSHFKSFHSRAGAGSIASAFGPSSTYSSQQEESTHYQRGVPISVRNVGGGQPAGVTSDPIRIPLNVGTYPAIGAPKLPQWAEGNEAQLAVINDNLQFLSRADAQRFAGRSWDDHLEFRRNGNARHIDLDRWQFGMMDDNPSVASRKGPSRIRS